ncbi:MAG TPA: glucans biosynthesis glucosyltransferase MdoH [Solimonas sp.]|nr:glucans biosynthesis glucosyltransferase MdoH [Solimonas sp.]
MSGPGAAAGDAAELAADELLLREATTRLRRDFAARPARGDARLDAVLEQDQDGHARLRTTPPLARASMVATPWDRNPLRRLWQRLAHRLPGRQMRPRHGGDPGRPAVATPWRVTGRNRRGLLGSLVIAQTLVATGFMSIVLPQQGGHPLEAALLALYALLFAWISAGFWTAVLGFILLLRGRERHAISATAAVDQAIDPAHRTAILVPICNEDVARVFAGVRATWDSIARSGAREHFDLYILSDSSRADARVAELEAWLQLCREVDGFGRIWYRRRTHRIRRKSGNIADWCRRWGSGYQYMVILDADSVMSGDCLKRLVQLMEANPSAGIIQTAPRASGRETLYARIQQFATRVYGPLFTAGLHFWQLGESHYWGHNAILRVAPFMQHCALGALPGKGALGGAILSHDFVEAALMRRAGWGVWIAYDLPGSYEEMPPTLLDELKRDQRWCQGNLQNFRLFFAAGLHPAHRAVFMTGVMAYLSAPLWFLFLLLSTALLAQNVLAEPEYFSAPYQLFPDWPQWHPEWALRLFSGTMGLLLVPKLLAALNLLLQRRGSKPYGGPARLLASLLLEMLFSALLAPIRMLFHTRYVLTALAGFAVQWKSPPREDAATPWSEALLRHGSGSLFGLAWLGLVYWLNPSFLAWLLPVAGALAIAVPLSVWSSRSALGRAARALRLFLIPEESQPPRELRWLKAALRRRPDAPGFVAGVREPALNALLLAAGRHRRNPLPGPQRARLRLAESLARGSPADAGEAARNTLLNDPRALARLHRRALAAPAWQEAPGP